MAVWVFWYVCMAMGVQCGRDDDGSAAPLVGVETVKILRHSDKLYTVRFRLSDPR